MGQSRAVMFLDPYGMSVNWTTLEAIRATNAIDVWYLVSLSGLFRQAALDRHAVDQSKWMAITRMLGTDEWESAWYHRTEQNDIFGMPFTENKRVANVNTMEGFVYERLCSLFPKVLNPLRLTDDRGVPTFALFFAMSNPDGKAIGLATRIANHILKSGKSSQVCPPVGSTARFLVATSPLLEKECSAHSITHSIYFVQPLDAHSASVQALITADDGPINSA